LAAKMASDEYKSNISNTKFEAKPSYAKFESLKGYVSDFLSQGINMEIKCLRGYSF
jgi:hypothetical protein